MASQTAYDLILNLRQQMPAQEADKAASDILGVEVSRLSAKDLGIGLEEWLGPNQTQPQPFKREELSGLPGLQSEYDLAQSEQRTMGSPATPVSLDPQSVNESFAYSQTQRDFDHEEDIKRQEKAEELRLQNEVDQGTALVMKKWQNNETVWDDVASLFKGAAEMSAFPILGPAGSVATDAALGTEISDNAAMRGMARATGTGARVGAELIDFVLGTELTASEDEAARLGAYLKDALKRDSDVVAERINRRSLLGIDEIKNIGADLSDIVQGVVGIAGFYTGLTDSSVKGLSANAQRGWDMGGQVMAAIGAEIAGLAGTEEGTWLDTVRTKPVSTFLTVVPLLRALTVLKNLPKIKGISAKKVVEKSKQFLSKWGPTHDRIIAAHKRVSDLPEGVAPPPVRPSVKPQLDPSLMTGPQKVANFLKTAGGQAGKLEKGISEYLGPVSGPIAAAKLLGKGSGFAASKIPKVRERLAEHSEADVQSALDDYERVATNIGDQSKGVLEREVIRTGEDPSSLDLDVDLDSGVSLKEQLPESVDPSRGMTPAATLRIPPEIRKIGDEERAKGRSGKSMAEEYWDIARSELLSGERKTFGVMLKEHKYSVEELNKIGESPERLREEAIKSGGFFDENTPNQQILADLSQVGLETKRVAINPSQQAPKGTKWVNPNTENPSLAPLDMNYSVRELWKPGDPLRGYVENRKMQSDVASSPTGSRFQAFNKEGRLNYGVAFELWKDLYQGHKGTPRLQRKEFGSDGVVEFTQNLNEQSGLETRGKAKTSIPYDRSTMARSAKAQEELRAREGQEKLPQKPSDEDVLLQDLVPGLKDKSKTSPPIDPTFRGLKAKIETGTDESGAPVYTEITGTAQQIIEQAKELAAQEKSSAAAPAVKGSERFKWQDAPADSPLWIDVRKSISEKRKEFPTKKKRPPLKNMSPEELAAELKSYEGREPLGLFNPEEWKKISKDTKTKVRDRRASREESPGLEEAPSPEQASSSKPIKETIEFEEGTYEGLTVDGVPQGWGLYREPGGYSEAGRFDKGVLKEGTLISEDGSWFNGTLKDGVLPFDGTLKGTKYGTVEYKNGVAYDANGNPLPKEAQGPLSAPKSAKEPGSKALEKPPKNPWDKIAEQSRRLAEKRKKDAAAKDEALRAKLDISSEKAQEYRKKIFKISEEVELLARQKVFFNGLKDSEKFFNEIESGKAPESLPLGFGDKDVARAIETLKSLSKPTKGQKSLLKRLENAEFAGSPKNTSSLIKRYESEGMDPDLAKSMAEMKTDDGWMRIPFGYLKKTRAPASSEFAGLMSEVGGVQSPIAKYLEDTGQRLMVPAGVNTNLAFMNIVRNARNQTDAISQMKAMMKRGLVSRRLRGIAHAFAGNWLTEALTDGNLAAPVFAMKDAAEFSKWQKDQSSVPKEKADFFKYAEANGLTQGDFIAGEIGRTLADISGDPTGMGWWDKFINSKPVQSFDKVNASQEKIWTFIDHSYKIRRAWNSYSKSRGDFLQISPGNPSVAKVSKLKSHKIEKNLDGTWSIDGKNVGSAKEGALPPRVEKVLADAAAFDANSKYFDYRFKSRYQAFLATNSVAALASPFYSWLFYAMSAPGKKGLAGAMLQTESAIKHTDPKLAFRQNVRKFNASVRLFLATKAARQDVEELSDEARKAVSYGNQAPVALTRDDDDHWFAKSLKSFSPVQVISDQLATVASGILELGTATGVIDGIEDFVEGNLPPGKEPSAEMKKLINRARLMATTPTIRNFVDFAGLGGGFGVNNMTKLFWGGKSPQESDAMAIILPAILGGTSADIINAAIGGIDETSSFTKRSKSPASTATQDWEDFASETVLSIGAQALGKGGAERLDRYVAAFNREWNKAYTKKLRSDLRHAEASKDRELARKIKKKIKRSDKLKKQARAALERELRTIK